MKLEDLPAARNRDQVILQMAEHDNEMHNIAAMLGEKPSSAHSYKFYLDLSISTLASVSKEVAAAKTEAEATAAKLRRTHILDATKELENVLLDKAHSLLKAGLITGDNFPDCAGYVGIGKRELGGAFEIIPAECWEIGTPNWAAMKLEIAPQPWFSVRVLKIHGLPSEDAAMFKERHQSRTQPTGSRSDSPPSRSVTPAALAAFLQQLVDNSPPGTSSEEALWKAAAENFAPVSVTRESVRRWIREFMPSDKRLSRGQKSQAWRSGDFKRNL